MTDTTTCANCGGRITKQLAIEDEAWFHEDGFVLCRFAVSATDVSVNRHSDAHPTVAARATAAWDSVSTREHAGLRTGYLAGFLAGWAASADYLDELATAREQYKFDPDGHIAVDVARARHLARILRDPESGLGWLPSWLWDEFGLGHSLDAPDA